MNRVTYRRLTSVFFSLMLSVSLMPAPRRPAPTTAGPGLTMMMGEAMKDLGPHGWRTSVRKRPLIRRKLDSTAL